MHQHSTLIVPKTEGPAEISEAINKTSTVDSHLIVSEGADTFDF